MFLRFKIPAVLYTDGIFVLKKFIPDNKNFIRPELQVFLNRTLGLDAHNINIIYYHEKSSFTYHSMPVSRKYTRPDQRQIDARF